MGMEDVLSKPLTDEEWNRLRKQDFVDDYERDTIGIRAARSAERLKIAVRRLLLYLELHEQAHPEWNGNRADDEAYARRALGEER